MCLYEIITAFYRPIPFTLLTIFNVTFEISWEKTEMKSMYTVEVWVVLIEWLTLNLINFVVIGWDDHDNGVY